MSRTSEKRGRLASLPIAMAHFDDVAVEGHVNEGTRGCAQDLALEGNGKTWGKFTGDDRRFSLLSLQDFFFLFCRQPLQKLFVL